MQAPTHTIHPVDPTPRRLRDGTNGGRTTCAARWLFLPLLLGGLVPRGPAQSSFRVVDLGILPGASTSIPFGINDLGDVTGVSTVGNAWQAFLYTDGQGMIPLGSLTGSGSATARDVNELRQVVGESGTTAFRWSAGTGIQALLSGQWARSNAVNNAGVVAGTLNPDALFGHTPFLFDPVQGLLQLAPGQSGRAKDVNEAGQVVGWAGSAAFRFTPGSGMTWLTPPAGFPLVQPAAINRHSETAGVMKSASGNTVHLFVHADATGFRDLGSVGQDGEASGSNDHGLIVGTRDFGVDHAFLYEPAVGIRDLNSLMPAGSGFHLTDAMSINNRGQIAVLAYDNNRGMFRALRLDPSGPTAAVRRIASGCGAGTATPALTADLPVLSGTSTLTLTMAPAATPALFALSFGAPRLGTLPNGCATYIDLTSVVPTPVFVTDPSGGGTFPLTIPGDPRFIGFALAAQAGVLGATGPSGIETSNGLLLVVGR